ncbi:twin-arginine translocation protein, TatA/E family protein [Maritimibacter alkaliphilus HTCC2654]|uniref:Sec-independent protein translocase protein TatA n=2 Tax=Roseobacteraceae TaxID=2854170 RepID=A3VCU1_9RHOB|nr:twin-arginine translocation protein, TatA/E family protein [Maritimibacter alkaliphilus HTCC2654]
MARSIGNLSDGATSGVERGSPDSGAAYQVRAKASEFCEIAKFRAVVWVSFHRHNSISAQGPNHLKRKGTNMLNNIGLPGLAIIAMVVIVLFGRGKLSSIMGEVGQGITSFRKGVEAKDEDETASV